MDPSIKSDFAVLCRTLRVQKGLKQRQVAEFLNVKSSTYGNVESSRFKVIRRDRAMRLVSLYELPPTGASELLDAWDRCPLSPYGERQRENWAKRNLQRSKSKMYDAMRIALCELVGVHIGAVPEDQICACVHEFAEDSVCEVCTSLELLGLDRFSGDRTRTINQLAALQDKLEAERAAAAQKAAKS